VTISLRTKKSQKGLLVPKIFLHLKNERFTAVNAREKTKNTPPKLEMSRPFRRALFARPSFSTSSSSSSENYQKAILEFERIASESSTPLGKAVKARANLLDAVTKHKQNLFDYGHTKKEKMKMEPMEGLLSPQALKEGEEMTKKASSSK
jgi:hypothetical protein